MFAFPVTDDKLDDRLRPGDLMFAVQVEDTHRAYRLTDRGDEVLTEEVGGREIVVIFRAEGPHGRRIFRGLERPDVQLRT